MERGPIFKTYVEEIADHDCELNIRYVVDEALYGKQFPTRRERFMMSFQRWCLPSHDHPYTTRFFKSTSSLSREIIRTVKDHPNVIHPFSMFRSNWEIFMLFMHLLALGLFPFILSFVKVGAGEYSYPTEYHLLDDEAKKELRKKRYLEVVPWDYVLMALSVITILDMMMNFDSGYVRSDNREIEMDRPQIAKRYMKTFFIFDVLSILPYGYVWRVHTNLNSLNYQWGEIIILLRIVRVYSIFQYYKQISEFFFQRFHFGYTAKRLVPTFFILFLIIHWLACFNVMLDMSIPDHRDDEYNSWTAVSRLYKRWNTTYEKAWSKSVARTVALLCGCTQNVLYATTQDIKMNLFASALGMVLVFYLAAEVALVTRISDAAKTSFEEMEVQLLEYVKYKQLPPDLGKRLMEYYKYCFRMNYFREGAILEFLSGQLRQEVLIHNCRRLTERVPFFFNVPPNLMIRIVTCLVKEVVLTNDVIIRAGTVGENMYFISCGSVAVYSASGEEVVHLKEGAHFGEIALIAERNYRIASIVAVETSELYALSRRDFEFAVAPDPELLASIQRTALRRLRSTRRAVVAGHRGSFVDTQLLVSAGERLSPRVLRQSRSLSDFDTDLYEPGGDGTLRESQIIRNRDLWRRSESFPESQFTPRSSKDPNLPTPSRISTVASKHSWKDSIKDSVMSWASRQTKRKEDEKKEDAPRTATRKSISSFNESSRPGTSIRPEMDFSDLYNKRRSPLEHRTPLHRSERWGSSPGRSRGSQGSQGSPGSMGRAIHKVNKKSSLPKTGKSSQIFWPQMY